jgi:protein-tyrosine phosphatase
MNSTNNDTWSSYFGNASKKLLNKAIDIAETNIKKVEDKVATLITENILEETASNIIISLELIYITENIISIAYPGNHLSIVSSYLNTNHKDHYMIWNISEESYTCSKFENQVLEHKFPGHPAPPLGLLFQICTEIENWLDADNKNVAVIHCLTGKGRTSSLISCLLTWLGEFDDPMLAMDYICQRKKTSIGILTIPSQRRYLDYFSTMINGIQPNSKPLLLRRVIINSIPKFGKNNDNEGCRPYIQIFKCGVLLATSSVTSPSSTSNTSTNNIDLKKQSTWINASEGFFINIKYFRCCYLFIFLSLINRQCIFYNQCCSSRRFIIKMSTFK